MGWKRPNCIFEVEQRIVEHREEAAAQHREDAELVVRPFDGAQGGAQRADFLATMKTFRAHQQVGNAARFQAAHIFLRQVGTVIGEAPEEDTDMFRADADPGSGHSVAHLPAALPAEPLNEGGHRVGRAGVDLHVGEIARAIWEWHGQRDDGRLVDGALDAALQRQVVFDGVFERGIDEALDPFGGTCAASKFARTDTVAAEALTDAMEEAGVGAAEAIDGLLRVAHHVELARRGLHLAPVALGGVGCSEQKQDFGLERVGVLEFVDEDALIDALEICARTIVAEQVAGAE